METKEYSVDIGGKTLTATFTNLADQAHGSVILRYGNTAVLATAVMSDTARDGLDYFPLTVDYEEKFYAAGQILGSRFMRREGRPSDEAILSGRAVDRTIRPLFDHRMRNEVQVIITVLSIDEDDPDTLAINAASLALATSDIPWNGPVAAVRIGKNGGNPTWIVNPDYSSRDHADATLDLLVCGKNGNVNMIELGAHEVPENDIAQALEHAATELATLESFQERIVGEIGKEKRSVAFEETPESVAALFETHIRPRVVDAVFSGTPGKKSIEGLKEEWARVVAAELPDENPNRAIAHFEHVIDKVLHEGVLKEGRRADGRDFDTVRPLYAQAGGISPILHGSGIFYRGGTHIFSALTLGGPGASQIIDSMEVQTKKRFLHHYNFPPFSTGETGRVGGMNRRMIGHGALAEKALRPIIPPVEKFPYTIRIVSEAFASNGSTSMGSVCASTIALMDGGVPITRPVAGIAMGLMMTPDKTAHRVLTDIQGPEDHHGDMDFKVAGTTEGVTALQMDVKVDGVPISILREALEQARAARLHILETITKEIAAPRDTINPNAPEILVTKINPTKIGLVIGGGGKTINGIKDDTGAEIDIEEDGTIFITGTQGAAAAAQKMIEEITHEYTAGERFEGIVDRILDFGAFVKIGREAEGLVHISELAPFRVAKVSDVVTIGETIPVVIREIDEQGRINLSLKDADPDFAKRKGVAPAPLQEPRRGADRRNHHGRRERS